LTAAKQPLSTCADKGKVEVCGVEEHGSHGKYLASENYGHCSTVFSRWQEEISKK
jgi:hypothetical protein